MTRRMITAELWERLSLALKEIGIYQTKGLRNQFEGMLWRLRVGGPWRDIPWEFGHWHTIYTKFRRWAKNGTTTLLTESVEGKINFSTGYVDSTSVRAHQSAHGCSKDQNNFIGRSRGGPTTKIHAIVDENCRPITFKITAGNCHDCPVGEEIVEDLEGVISEIVADKGYDSDKLRGLCEELEIRSVIPRRGNSKKPKRGFHKAKYRKRHVVENFFAMIKKYRSLATRYDKTLESFSAMLNLAVICLWIKI